MNVGDVGAIRAAAAACLQKHPHLSTTVSDNLEEKASPAPSATPSTSMLRLCLALQGFS